MKDSKGFKIRIACAIIPFVVAAGILGTGLYLEIKFYPNVKNCSIKERFDESSEDIKGCVFIMLVLASVTLYFGIFCLVMGYTCLVGRYPDAYIRCCNSYRECLDSIQGLEVCSIRCCCTCVLLFFCRCTSMLYESIEQCVSNIFIGKDSHARAFIEVGWRKNIKSASLAETRFIKRLIKETWMDSYTYGRDATNLTHTKIKVLEIMKITKGEAKTAYEEKRRVMNKINLSRDQNHRNYQNVIE